MTERVLILGAAGRDFHHFNVEYRDNQSIEVVGFTATQIPDIAGRSYPVELAGERYPNGIPIFEEDRMEQLIDELSVDRVVFAYSDVTHLHVMHLASRAVAAGASMELPATRLLESRLPVVAVTAVRTGAGKSPASRRVRRILTEAGKRVGVVRHPMPYGDLYRQRVQRFASYGDLAEHNTTIEEREEYESHLEEGSV
ncbi:MAG: GTPase, partial [Acidimicrobiia bacterium]|nr:GTPase [Acidimicrobiia bacterium]